MQWILKAPARQWHSLKSLESGTVLLECKDGGVSQDKVIAVRDKSFWDHRIKTRVEDLL